MIPAIRFGVFADPGAVFTLKQAALNTEDTRLIEAKETAKARLNPYFESLSDHLMVGSLDDLYEDVKTGGNSSLLVSGANDLERLATYQTAEASLTKRLHSIAKPPHGSTSHDIAAHQARLATMANLLKNAFHLVVRPEDNLFRVLKMGIERLAYSQRAAELAEGRQPKAVPPIASISSPAIL